MCLVPACQPVFGRVCIFSERRMLGSCTYCVSGPHQPKLALTVELELKDAWCVCGPSCHSRLHLLIQDDDVFVGPRVICSCM